MNYIKDVLSRRDFYAKGADKIAEAQSEGTIPKDVAAASIARLIAAWVVGIAVWVALSGKATDGNAGTVLSILGAMFGARIGMIIHTKRFHGGVTRRGNILFARWVLSLIALAILGTLTEVSLDALFEDSRTLKGIAVAVVLNGAGFFLLVKWHLAPGALKLDA